MKTKCKPYRWWINRIESCEPLTFTRYGDGEFKAIRGTKKNNCDGHYLGNKKMRQELIQSIKQPGNAKNYIRGLWMTKNCQAQRQFGQNWQGWTRTNGLQHLVWWDGLMFNFANNDGRNWPFINVMRHLKLPIVVIGPRHLRSLDNEVFDYAAFVEVPYRQAYSSRDRILARRCKSSRRCAIRYTPDRLRRCSLGDCGKSGAIVV